MLILGDDAPQFPFGRGISGLRSIQVAYGHGAEQAGFGGPRQHPVDARFSCRAPLSRQHVAVMEHRSILLQFAPGIRAPRGPPVRRRRKHEKKWKHALSVDHEELLFVDFHAGGIRGARQHD